VQRGLTGLKSRNYVARGTEAQGKEGDQRVTAWGQTMDLFKDSSLRGADLLGLEKTARTGVKREEDKKFKKTKAQMKGNYDTIFQKVI